MRLVLDTNTLISAMGWKGKQRHILDTCISGKHELIESIELISEFVRVMKDKKFGFLSGSEKQEFLVSLISVCEIVQPSQKINELAQDPSDNIVLECAVAGKAEAIITGDEHLLKLKEFRGIKVINAAQFLERL
jgi:uncharacterized protein